MCTEDRYAEPVALKEALSGSTFQGPTPTGTATANESQFSGCGGFGVLSIQVKDGNLPDGTQLWVTFDDKPVGIITLTGHSGSMAPCNLGTLA